MQCRDAPLRAPSSASTPGAAPPQRPRLSHLAPTWSQGPVRSRRIRAAREAVKGTRARPMGYWLQLAPAAPCRSWSRQSDEPAVGWGNWPVAAGLPRRLAVARWGRVREPPAARTWAARCRSWCPAGLLWAATAERWRAALAEVGAPVEASPTFHPSSGRRRVKPRHNHCRPTAGRDSACRTGRTASFPADYSVFPLSGGIVGGVWACRPSDPKSRGFGRARRFDLWG